MKRLIRWLFPIPLILACASETPRDRILKEIEINSCMAVADARAIKAGYSQCADKGLEWDACPAKPAIQEQHQRELAQCL
jgi:hypothetical protein